MKPLLLFLLFLFPLAVSAQPMASPDDPQRVKGLINLTFLTGIPSGPFADNLDQAGFGGEFTIGARFGASPFIVGLNTAFVVYGRSSDRVPFSSTVGPRVTVDVVTTNSVVQPNLFLRLQPATGVARPYVEARGGFSYFFTDTRIEDVDFGEDQNIASTTNFDDFTLSGGFGGGVDVRVYRWIQEDNGRPGAVFVNLGATYMLGREAEYLAEGDLVDLNNNGRLDRSELDIRRSRTDLILPRFGVSFTF